MVKVVKVEASWVAATVAVMEAKVWEEGRAHRQAPRQPVESIPRRYFQVLRRAVKKKLPSTSHLPPARQTRSA